MRRGPLGQGIGIKIALSLEKTTPSVDFQVSLTLVHRDYY